MNRRLDILNNTNKIFENDVVIINLKTEHITWKPMMWNPKYANEIVFWLNERKKINVG